MKPCVVCGATHQIMEEHHVIPRSCGGERGPTVTLCGVHHSMIHDTADQMTAAYLQGHRHLNPDRWQWTGPDRQFWGKAFPLIRSVAEAQVAQPPEEARHPIMFKLNPREKRMLIELQRRMGVSSQEKAIRRALDLAARQLGL